MKSDKTVSIETLKLILRQFRDKRNWAQFHDPKNLAEAITIEASELLELFLWKKPEEIERLVKSERAAVANSPAQDTAQDIAAALI